jgi:hypothetical protein
MRSFGRRHTLSRWLTGAAAFVLLFAIMLPVNAALPGSSFESNDGNLVVDGGASALDWANAPNRQAALDKPTGQQDDSFGNGTKEDTAVPTVVDGSIPNNKSDLTRFYVANDKVAGKDFLYLAWERVQEPTGTTNMDFEFNQSKVLSSNGVTPVRTAGDVLIKYDLSQGGTNPTLGFHRWVTSGQASQVCEASNSLPCWGKVQPLAGNFEGAINTAPVSDPIAPDAPRSLSARTFGEAAINLTDSGIFPAGQCTAFGKAYLKSRSSDAFTAAVKDFVAPIDINVSNCGGITIHKDALPDGPTDFAYSTTGGLSPVSFSLDDDTNATLSNTQTYAAIQQGTYTVTEGATSGFDLTNIACTVTGTGGTTYTPDLNARTVTIQLKPLDSVDCTFTNTQRGSITIVKNTSGGNDTFAFTGTGTGVDPSFNIATAAGTGSKTFNNLAPGAYSVTETGPQSGWQFTSLSCGAGGVVDGSNGQKANITLPAGGNVTCTFSNTKQGSITIVKDAVPNAVKDFDFSTTGGLSPSTFSLDDDGSEDAANGGLKSSKTYSNVPPGAYSVTEGDAGSNWDLTGLSCDVTGAGTSATPDKPNHLASITLGAGGSVTCTFTNTQRASIVILKKDDAGAVLAGAEFTLYKDAAPTGGAAPGQEDNVAVGQPCVTDANGTCSFTNLVPGDYWAVETDTPDGYETADPQPATVGAGGEVTLTFEDARLFKVIVLVCKQSDHTLYASHVTFDGGTEQTSIKGSDLPTSLQSLESDLCGLGGATLNGVQANDGGAYHAAVTIPKQAL